MLASIIWILLAGFCLGQIARRLQAPPLVGMILAGILLGPQVANVIGAETLGAADALRTIAVMVILMKAGLGLDREKLAQQGTVALRLGFLPGACEAIVVAVISIWLLNFDFLTGLLLGCIVGAESPAVIVPGMLRLKRLGWGVQKGIPDAILTGSALSDVSLLLVFSLLLAFLSQAEATGLSLPGGLALSPLQLLPFQIILQISLGLAIGWAIAKLLVTLLAKRKWTQNSVQDTVITAGFALLLVVLAAQVPVFSGYLAVMTTGFFLIEFNAPLARELRNGFDSLWIAAEIVLFVLLGASIQLQVLEDSFLVGLLLLAVGTLLGRSLGWYLSTLGSNWNLKEKLFLLPGNSAKATVQAAIGAVPLAQGISGGETILAISALSILITAPLGAWAIPTFAPRLLERGVVDPTKVAIAQKAIILAAINSPATAVQVLTKAAAIARQGESEVVAFHVTNQNDLVNLEQLKLTVGQSLADINHQFHTVEGDPEAEIIRAAQMYGATEIVIGKRNSLSAKSVGLVARSVLEQSHLPVVVVENKSI
ncbi:MAG: sodium:proton antiporter [Leptolyngbya foveolarum]|uniref:Sodium:proton antiporter n=1 Tax=Leptolyngbya foveolarum TaxID=47253 RepID=A0A2W4UIF2_9CYAN|nr:MAG: sodium:proton antiporter [Leptolyngbya foveolarum]